MARGVNKAILVGNLGNDPDVKWTQGGMAVCRISLATTTVRKDREGNAVEKVEWHRVVFFGKLGEIAGEYLKKGSQVYVEGRISYSESEGQDGVKRYFTDVIADEMQMLGGGGGQLRQHGGGVIHQRRVLLARFGGAKFRASAQQEFTGKRQPAEQGLQIIGGSGHGCSSGRGRAGPEGPALCRYARNGF